jgi:hypothetical protein
MAGEKESSFEKKLTGDRALLTRAPAISSFHRR